MAARVPLSATSNKTLFDSLDMFGPLIVARSTEDASINLFLSNQDDQLAFMKSAEVSPAIFKIPECPEVHLGNFYTTESYMSVEVCPGRILIVQSNLISAIQNDENSWIAIFRRNALGISMTIVLLGTGIYQYFKIRGNKK